MIGGFDGSGNPIASLEVYSPTIGAFSMLPISGGAASGMVSPRALHTSTLLSNETILVAGGCATAVCSPGVMSAEVIDVSTAVTSLVGAMNAAHVGATATRLLNGTVLVAGGATSVVGAGTEFGEIFTGSGFACPGSDCTSGRQRMAVPRARHAAVLLSNGQVAFFGGLNGLGSPTSSIETFDPGGGFGTTPGQFNLNAMTLSVPRQQLQATPTGGAGRVLVSGGFGASGTPSAAVDLFDVTGTSFTLVNGASNLTTARGAHTATLFRAGGILVAGGVSSTVPAEVFSSAQ